jgi:creatinine amidohydrolase
VSAEALLRARLAELPRCLRDVAAGRPTIERSSSFVVTGIGASEAPARAMAALARTELRARAAFVPLSAFASRSPEGDVLVVFSQGLSPNARLALARAGDYASSVLFTSVREPIPGFGGRIIVLPPEREDGTLVRVLGPSAAMLAAAIATGAADDVDPLFDAIASAPARARDAARHVESARLFGRVAFVTTAGHGELCHAARNAWLEALCTPEPPSWDVLQIAHGPFQEFFDSEILLIALELGEDALVDRLARMIVPERHALVRLRSSLAPALAAIDHVAQVHELVCCALAARPRDLGAWPGSGRDAPLYDLGK